MNLCICIFIFQIELLIDRLWLDTGKDKHYAINIPENKLLFNHNINKEKEHIINSTIINFQNNKSVLLDTKAFKIDAVKIFNKYNGK